jgi:hypothetical protein
MTQTTYTDNVLIDGSQDIEQLRVQGDTSQDEALQTWENSAGDVLAQVSGDGRVLIGDDVGLSSPNALLEAHRDAASTAKPKRGFHSLGQVSGTLASLVQWLVGELELRGSTAIDALHTVLRIRAANMNTGTPTSNAELRGGDIEVVNDAAAGAAALPKATGLQVGISNASGKEITDAVALRLKINNAGTISNAYVIFTEGAGITHLEDVLEMKRQTSAPGTPATNFMRVYPKSDGKLYAKNWSGAEYDLTSGSGSGNASYTDAYATHPTPVSSGDLFFPSNGVGLERYDGSEWLPWGPIFPLTPPVNGDFSWVNQGTGSVTAATGSIYLLAPSIGSNSNALRIRKKSAPSTPYTITVALLSPNLRESYISYGIGFRESSSGKLHLLSIQGSTEYNALLLASIKHSDPSTFHSSYALDYLSAAPLFLRMSDDGTNRAFSFSVDGQNFIPYHSVSRTDYLTADEVCFWANSAHATWPSAATLLSWKEE